jgi:hypothetical protein
MLAYDCQIPFQMWPLKFIKLKYIINYILDKFLSFKIQKTIIIISTNYIDLIRYLYLSLSFYKDMFKVMLDYNASLNIKNKQGLTPLTLAAKLARKEVKI